MGLLPRMSDWDLEYLTKSCKYQSCCDNNTAVFIEHVLCVMTIRVFKDITLFTPHNTFEVEAAISSI